MKTIVSVIQFAALATVLVASTYVDALDTVSQHMNFYIKNGESVNDAGTIQNAALNWGIWMQGGKEVGSVNNIGFDRSQAATFSAAGRKYTPSGAEGSFEIHENRKKIAVVQFAVPFWGENQLYLQQSDKKFLCNHDGFSSTGSPTINIICHKIASGGI